MVSSMMPLGPAGVRRKGVVWVGGGINLQLGKLRGSSGAQQAQGAVVPEAAAGVEQVQGAAGPLMGGRARMRLG
jgi:hypothetical protein